MDDTRTREHRFLHDDEAITLEIPIADWLDVLGWLIPTDAIDAVGPGRDSQHYSVSLRLPAASWWRDFDLIHQTERES